jgi:hypothetical protein
MGYSPHRNGRGSLRNLWVMPQAILSLPPDSQPSKRVLFDKTDSRCHAIQIVRHVPLPQLEAIRETQADDNKIHEAEIIGGIFLNPENIQVVVQLDDKQAREAYTEALSKAISSGNILVAMDDVINPGPVIEVFGNHNTQSCRMVLVEWAEWVAEPEQSELP